MRGPIALALLLALLPLFVPAAAGQETHRLRPHWEQGTAVNLSTRTSIDLKGTVTQQGSSSPRTLKAETVERIEETVLAARDGRAVQRKRKYVQSTETKEVQGKRQASNRPLHGRTVVWAVEPGGKLRVIEPSGGAELAQALAGEGDGVEWLPAQPVAVGHRWKLDGPQVGPDFGFPREQVKRARLEARLVDVLLHRGVRAARIDITLELLATVPGQQLEMTFTVSGQVHLDLDHRLPLQSDLRGRLRMRSTGGPVTLDLAGSIAIKSLVRPAGARTWRLRSAQHQGATSVTTSTLKFDAKGTVTRQGAQSPVALERTTVERYEETVLEAAGGQALRTRRRYLESTETDRAGGKAARSNRPLHGQTLVLGLRDGKTVVLEPARPSAEIQRAIAEEGDPDAWLPEQPVPVGKRWKLDGLAAARAFGITREQTKQAVLEAHFAEVLVRQGVETARIELSFTIEALDAAQQLTVTINARGEQLVDLVRQRAHSFRAQGRIRFASPALALEGPVSLQAEVADPAAGLVPGLYYGFQTRTRLDLRNRLVSRTYHYYYYFLPGGRVYYGLPKGGLDTFDFEQAARRDPKNCATYQLAGDRVRLTWGGGAKPTELSFAVLGPVAVRLNGDRYYRQHTATAGLRLDGVYVDSRYTPTLSGGVAGETRFAFDRTGRYAMRNWTGITGDVESPSGSAFLPDGRVKFAGSSEFGNAGTYRFADGALELVVKGGKRIRLTCYLPPEGAGKERPGLLYLDGRGYLRAK